MMRLLQLKYIVLVLAIAGITACKNKSAKKEAANAVFKGLYSLGPEAKIFKECSTGKEYWVTDKSAQLELKYWQETPSEKPEPAYIEVEGNIVNSDLNDNGGHDEDGGYEKTLIVTKLITLTKNIPTGCKLP